MKIIALNNTYLKTLMKFSKYVFCLMKIFYDWRHKFLILVVIKQLRNILNYQNYKTVAV